VDTIARLPPPSREWLLQPRVEWARGHVRAGIEAIQAELVADRRRCRDAFGAGSKWLRRVPLPDEVDAVRAGDAIRIRTGVYAAAGVMPSGS
jgi:hypothetical protein